jgi:hypothetical protein
MAALRSDEGSEPHGRFLDATGGCGYVCAMKIEPKAMAIPKSTDHLEKGRYGPIFPKTPSCCSERRD